jgi:hypothetical protein
LDGLKKGAQQWQSQPPYETVRLERSAPIRFGAELGFVQNTIGDRQGHNEKQHEEPKAEEPLRIFEVPDPMLKAARAGQTNIRVTFAMEAPSITKRVQRIITLPKYINQYP